MVTVARLLTHRKCTVIYVICQLVRGVKRQYIASCGRYHVVNVPFQYGYDLQSKSVGKLRARLETPFPLGKSVVPFGSGALRPKAVAGIFPATK